MAKAKAIVIGAGGISGAWFPPLKAEKVDVVAVVDLRKEAAEQRIEQHELKGAIGSDDLAKTLRECDADFAVDLTVPEAHCKVTCAALKAGLHVVSEKPMASSLAECRRMVRTAEQTGKLYMVSQSRRYNQTHDTVRRTVTGGSVGQLTTVNCDFYLGAHFGGFRDQMPSPLILDMSIHHFDLVRMMTGLDPVAVYAREFNPHGSWYKGDVAASCIFEMTHNVMFTYSGSWCAEGCHTSWNGDWRFIGDKGTLLYDHDQPPQGEVIANKTGFNRSLKPAKVRQSNLKFAGQHGALRELLAYMRNGSMPQGECHDNIKSMAMVFATVQSSGAGRRVPVRW